MTITNGAVTDESVHTCFDADFSLPVPNAIAIEGYAPATGDNCVNLVDLCHY